MHSLYNIKTTDVLENPITIDNLDSALWNDKCDYVDIGDCTNLNPNCYNLIVLQFNIRSLLSNQVALNQLQRDLENRKSKADLILLCETFLSDQTCKLVNMPGYALISNEQKNHKGVAQGY